MAHALGLATPLADLCAKLWDDAAQALSATADHTEIIRHLRQFREQGSTAVTGARE
jgi:hypothetical protein